MRWFKLTLAYDGTAYHGWQLQAGQLTVQDRLEAAWREVTQQAVRATASGRTDAGVHALGQVVSCSVATMLSAPVLLQALNANLPLDIRVVKCREVPAGFDAIRDAQSKTYHYWLRDGRLPEIFCRHFCWFIPHDLDPGLMHRAAQALVGQHDFLGYQSAGSARQTTVRTVHHLTVARTRVGWADLIRLEINADGFLYNMVRIIVGTLVAVGKGKQPVEWPAEVLAARDRRLAGPTAPAQGLFLAEVSYEPPWNG